MVQPDDVGADLSEIPGMGLKGVLKGFHRVQVYNVTEFAKEHPGGKVIYTHAGKDATDAFSIFHAPSTWTVLQQYCIGTYVVSVSATSTDI